MINVIGFLHEQTGKTLFNEMYDMCNMKIVRMICVYVYDMCKCKLFPILLVTVKINVKDNTKSLTEFMFLKNFRIYLKKNYFNGVFNSISIYSINKKIISTGICIEAFLLILVI